MSESHTPVRFFLKAASRTWVWGVAFSVWMLALILGSQVFFRYVIGSSLVWGEEAARYLLVTITFLAPLVLIPKGHLTAFSLVGNIPTNSGWWITFRKRLPEIVFYLAFCWSAVSLIVKTHGQHSIALGLPMYVVYATMVIFGAGGVAGVLCARFMLGKY